MRLVFKLPLQKKRKKEKMALATMFVKYVWPQECIWWPKALIAIIGNYAMGGILCVCKDGSLCLFHVNETEYWMLGSNPHIKHIMFDNNVLYCQRSKHIERYKPLTDMWEEIVLPVGPSDSDTQIQMTFYGKVIIFNAKYEMFATRTQLCMAFDSIARCLWVLYPTSVDQHFASKKQISTNQPPVLRNRWDHGTCTVFKGSFYVFNNDEAMMFTGHAWRHLANLRRARYDATAVAHNNCIYLIGGTYGGGNIFYDPCIDCYNPDLDKWTTVIDTPFIQNGIDAAICI